MAYSSKAEQRLAGSTNYSGSTSTLESDNVKGPKDMGNNGPNKLMGKMDFSNGGSKKLYGSTVKASASSGVSGSMSGAGFPKGARQARIDGGKGPRGSK